MAKKKREIKKKSFADLPEPIIQHILSFLPEKDAAKTSILSKAWLSAWRTKPNLYFYFKLFVDELKLYNMGSEEKEKIRKKFFKYVKRTLKRYTQQKMSIETLKLDVKNSSIFEDYSVVERCTRVAVERGVTSLHLFGYVYGELPQIIVGAKSVVDLSLRGFNMLHLSTEKIMWSSLKRLCFLFVCFDEVMFDNIISSCPLLEILEISYCTSDADDEFDNQFKLKVIDHHNLKQLTVRLQPSQRLILAETPKLESLFCTNHEDCLEQVDWIPCGLSLCSSQYQNLKMLYLCAVGITDKFFNNLEQKFPHLQDLSVQYCEDLRRIKISSQTLQRIELVENYKLEEAHFDVPSIEHLKYTCDECESIPEFSFTATNGHWRISKLMIRWMGNANSSWFLQLKKFLINLIPSKIFLNMTIEGGIELDMNEIRNSVREPQELQELSLTLSEGVDSSSIISVLDGFFAICRPNSISQYWKDCDGNDPFMKLVCDENDPFMKLVCDMLMLRTNQDQHHKLQQIGSWQHDLRQVKVQIDDSIKIVYNKNGLVDDQQPEALDWESIFKMELHS